MSRKLNPVLVVASLAIALGSDCVDSATAETIEARFHSISPSQGVDFTLNGNRGSTVAGVFNWTRTGGSYNGIGPSINDSIDSFCIELTQHISYGQTYAYEVTDLSKASLHPVGMGEFKASAVASLWDQHHADTMTDDEAAAFQVSTWEIVHDTGFDLAAGVFKVNTVAGYVDLAQSWLGALDLHGRRASLLALSRDGAQDHVFEVIPAPGAAGLAIIAGTLIGLRRKVKAR